MKKHLLIFFLFVSVLGFSQDKQVEVPQILVKIGLGETITFKKAKVKFLKVVWVAVTEAGKEMQQVELLYGKRINKLIFSSEGYSLKGMSLTPYPPSANSGKMDYVLLVSEQVN